MIADLGLRRGILYGLPLALGLWLLLFTLYAFGQETTSPIPTPPPITQQRFEQLLGEAYAHGYSAGAHHQDQYIYVLQQRILQLQLKPTEPSLP